MDYYLKRAGAQRTPDRNPEAANRCPVGTALQDHGFALPTCTHICLQNTYTGLDLSLLIEIISVINRNKRSLRPTMWTSLVAQSVKNLPAMAGDPGSIPGSGIPWRRKGQPSPSILA